MRKSADNTAAPAVQRLRDDRVVEDLRTLLPGWLGGRRWFAGKGHGTPELDPFTVTVLWPGDPALLQTVVRTGDGDRYHLLIGARRSMPAGLDAAVIGRGGEGGALTFYEACEDAALMRRLIGRFAAGDTGGPVEFHRAPGADVPLGLAAKPSTAEQSNTSVMFADRMMLKILRRPVVGVSPELELLAALHRPPAVPGAAPLAWMDTSPRAADGPMTLAVLQEFVPSRGDGWTLAVEAAGAYLTAGGGPGAGPGGFEEEARRLGRATAEVHLALADRLPARVLSAAEAGEWVASLTARLDAAVEEVPALRAYAGPLRALHGEVGELVRRGEPLSVQRIHGDLHLGQVLRGERGWVLIDFEGEPGKSPRARRSPQPALRDVAAMLRSFDYAAHHAVAGVLGAPPGGPSGAGPRRERLLREASAWAVRNRRAFGAGYADAGGPAPAGSPVLLCAFEADKAVYEAVYEARNRPGWLPIPLAAVRRLARGERAAD